MPTDRATLELLAVEASMRVAKELGRALPAGVGFAVLVFDFGRGNLSYVSNADRASMLQAMKEFIQKNEAGPVQSVFAGPRS